jgi:hypothetical protein
MGRPKETTAAPGLWHARVLVKLWVGLGERHRGEGGHIRSKELVAMFLARRTRFRRHRDATRLIVQVKLRGW